MELFSSRKYNVHRVGNALILLPRRRPRYTYGVGVTEKKQNTQILLRLIINGRKVII